MSSMWRFRWCGRSERTPRPRTPERAAGQVRQAGERAKATTRQLQNPYGVQVGAFQKSKQARHALQVALRRAPDLLRGTIVSVGTMQARNRTMFRATLVGLSKTDAEFSCKKLKNSARIASSSRPVRSRSPHADRRHLEGFSPRLAVWLQIDGGARLAIIAAVAAEPSAVRRPSRLNGLARVGQPRSKDRLARPGKGAATMQPALQIIFTGWRPRKRSRRGFASGRRVEQGRAPN